jgi:Cys-tRNA(Pro) deacylase
MGRQKTPKTTAIRALQQARVEFQPHFYKYEDRGGTAVSSRELGVDEHQVIKTLVMETNAGDPLVILMHGDLSVSTKGLARHLGVKTVSPCRPEVAQRHSGYQVGGTSPFGLRKPLPIYAESTIQALPRLLINGGKRGFLVEMTPDALASALDIVWVEAAA